MSWRITVTGEFSAGHALRHYMGKCENMHGHNFKVEATVTGSRLDPDTGMLLDFTIFKKELRRILQEMDHIILNDQPPFDKINPSSELISRHIWQKLDEFLKSRADGCELFSVTVSEKETQWATYLGEK